MTLQELLDEACRTIIRLQPLDAARALERGAALVDVRQALSRDRDGVIPGSIHIPRTVLEWRLDPDGSFRTPFVRGLEQQVILICDHGCSTILAAATLARLGYPNVGDVLGGYAAWREAGLPTQPAKDHTLAPGELPGMRPPEA